jgi:hypothetical protein
VRQAPGLADENGNNGELPKIVVGVCAMDRKVSCGTTAYLTSPSGQRVSHRCCSGGFIVERISNML